jgi:hypothetical protein
MARAPQGNIELVPGKKVFRFQLAAARRGTRLTINITS